MAARERPRDRPREQRAIDRATSRPIDEGGARPRINNSYVLIATRKRYAVPGQVVSISSSLPFYLFKQYSQYAEIDDNNTRSWVRGSK